MIVHLKLLVKDSNFMFRKARYIHLLFRPQFWARPRCFPQHWTDYREDCSILVQVSLRFWCNACQYCFVSTYPNQETLEYGQINHHYFGLSIVNETSDDQCWSVFSEELLKSNVISPTKLWSPVSCAATTRRIGRPWPKWRQRPDQMLLSSTSLVPMDWVS